MPAVLNACLWWLVIRHLVNKKSYQKHFKSLTLKPQQMKVKMQIWMMIQALLQGLTTIWRTLGIQSRNMETNFCGICIALQVSCKLLTLHLQRTVCYVADLLLSIWWALMSVVQKPERAWCACSAALSWIAMLFQRRIWDGSMWQTHMKMRIRMAFIELKEKEENGRGVFTSQLVWYACSLSYHAVSMPWSCDKAKIPVSLMLVNWRFTCCVMLSTPTNFWGDMQHNWIQTPVTLALLTHRWQRISGSACIATSRWLPCSFRQTLLRIDHKWPQMSLRHFRNKK